MQRKIKKRKLKRVPVQVHWLDLVTKIANVLQALCIEKRIGVVV